jgi:hypothetical protein
MIVLCIVLLAACSKKTEHEQRRELLRVPESRIASVTPTRINNWYDEKGSLLPSEEVFAGLKLPQGLELRRRTELTRVYETMVPPSKLHWYFGARLTTSNITQVSGNTTYVAATLSDAKGETSRFNVTITPPRIKKGKTLVEISQLMPRKQTPPIPELMKELAGKRGVID